MYQTVQNLSSPASVAYLHVQSTVLSASNACTARPRRSVRICSSPLLISDPLWTSRIPAQLLYDWLEQLAVPPIAVTELRRALPLCAISSASPLDDQEATIKTTTSFDGTPEGAGLSYAGALVCVRQMIACREAEVETTAIVRDCTRGAVVPTLICHRYWAFVGEKEAPIRSATTGSPLCGRWTRATDFPPARVGPYHHPPSPAYCRSRCRLPIVQLSRMVPFVVFHRGLRLAVVYQPQGSTRAPPRLTDTERSVGLLSWLFDSGFSCEDQKYYAFRASPKGPSLVFPQIHRPLVTARLTTHF